MKAKLIVRVLFVIFILVGCSAVTIPAPVKTTTSSQTSTSIRVLPAFTSTPTSWWVITATPLSFPSNNNNEIVSIIDQLHPNLCIKNVTNFAILTPPPIDAPNPELKFTEVSVLPSPQQNYINERADNIDKSHTAFAIPKLGTVSDLYIKDNQTGKIFQVSFGASPYRGLDWLQWINKDILFVTQQGHFLILIAAINVVKQEFEYSGYDPGCPATSTP